MCNKEVQSTDQDQHVTPIQRAREAVQRAEERTRDQRLCYLRELFDHIRTQPPNSTLKVIDRQIRELLDYEVASIVATWGQYEIDSDQYVGLIYYKNYVKAARSYRAEFLKEMRKHRIICSGN